MIIHANRLVTVERRKEGSDLIVQRQAFIRFDT